MSSAPSPAIPSGKLLELLDASDKIMQSILRHDRQRTYEIVARSLHDLLDAESCALFLVPPGDPGYLVLEAQCTDEQGLGNDEKIRLPIHRVEHGGLTGSIAARGEVTRLTGAELRNDRFAAGSEPRHLRSRKCCSLLGFPLMSRRGCVGLLKVENKRTIGAETAVDESFTLIDEQIARLFAAKMLLLLESCRTMDALGELLEAAERSHDLDEMFELILKCGLKLLDADRGDIAWLDESKGDLTLISTRGPCCLEKGSVISQKSVMGTVWTNGRGEIIDDVSACDFYYCLDKSTKSEVAVLVRYEGRMVGVLNAESTKALYFTERDREILELLGHHAAIAVKTYGKAAQFRERVRQLAEQKSPELKGLLQDVLLDLRKVLGFDAGLIYIPDHVNKRLNCTAWIGCEGLEIDPEEFSYGLFENALATKVFREMSPYFSQEPSKDTNVNQKGLEAFRVEGPILGLPLVYRGDPVGALVLWSRTGPVPTVGSVEDTQPLANIAALAAGVSSAAERHSVSSEDYAHSLEDPLGAVSKLVEKLGKLLAENDLGGLREWLPVLKQEKDRLLRFADQTRAYSRLTGRSSPRILIDLRRVLESRLRIWAALADEKNVKVEEALGNEPATVFGNEDDLAEACSNLFHNALKFSTVNQKSGLP